MELWIRSQDRECLMKINRIDYDYSLGEHKILVNGYQTLVGKYKTKERALEVLDEIQDILKPRIITTGYECECKDSLVDKMSFNLEMIPTKTEIKEISTYIYEMPKD